MSARDHKVGEEQGPKDERDDAMEQTHTNGTNGVSSNGAAMMPTEDEDIERAGIQEERSPIDDMIARAAAAGELADQAIVDEDISLLSALPVEARPLTYRRLKASGVDIPTLKLRVKIADGAARKAAEIRAQKRVAEREPALLRAPPVKLLEGTDEESERAAAERLLAWHGEDIKYAQGIGWLAWDGRRWAQDEAMVSELGHATLRTMRLQASDDYREASAKVAAMMGAGDMNAIQAANDALGRVKGLLKYIKGAQSARGVAGILASASTLPALRIKAEDLDKDPFLFNVANGTIDFRRSEIRSHDRRDLITKMGPCAYSPEEDEYDQQWRQFLLAACQGSAPLVEWLRLIGGYSLTGDTSQEHLYFISGRPGSGKGTWLEAVRKVMGDYCGSTTFDTWCRREGPTTLRPDLASLRGLRMVSCSEVDASKKLDEGVISNATGNEAGITCRFLYKDQFTYDPLFKLWMVANDKPKANNVKEATGLWRRLKLIPFDLAVSDGDKDPDVKRKFRDIDRGAPAVLRFLVSGAIDYARIGKLVEPDLVRESTEAYREENNPIREFFAEHYIATPKDPESYVTAASLRKAYEEWCKIEGIKYPISGKDMGRQLRQYGCVPGSTRISGQKAKTWRGLRARADYDDAIAAGAENDGR